MKVANVKLSWKNPLPAGDTVKLTLFIVINGVVTEREYDPEITETLVDVPAGASVQFRVVATNATGQNEQGGVYSFTLNDLDRPQPATALSHEVLSVSDE